MLKEINEGRAQWRSGALFRLIGTWGLVLFLAWQEGLGGTMNNFKTLRPETLLAWQKVFGRVRALGMSFLIAFRALGMSFLIAFFLFLFDNNDPAMR